MKPCCNWEGPSITYGKDAKPEDLINHSDMIKYREMSLVGKWPDGCIRCKTRQEQGLKSYRDTENKRANVTSPRQLREATPEIRTIDYRASSTDITPLSANGPFHLLMQYSASFQFIAGSYCSLI